MPADPNLPDAAVVELDALAFDWPGQARPLLQIDQFELPPCERLFLRGPSGSGESALPSLVAGVPVPRSGTLRVPGLSLGELGGAGCDRFAPIASVSFPISRIPGNRARRYLLLDGMIVRT